MKTKFLADGFETIRGTTEPAYHYRAFGLNIASEFECPALMPGGGEPDVYLHYGKTPESMEKAKFSGRFFAVKPGQLLFYVDGVARFFVTNGREIIVEPAEGSDADAVRLFLFGNVFAGLLQQRGHLPLHGSAVETGNGVAVFVGRHGAGKSTLAAAFRSRGYRIFTDDLCVITRKHDDTPEAHPGYPEMKMTVETANRLGVDVTSLRNIETWKKKYVLPFRERFSDRPRPLTRVYLLNPSQEENFELISVEGLDKFQVLLAHTFRYDFLEGLGKGAAHFQLATSIARHVVMKRVVRPREGFRLNELVDLLERDFWKIST